jgi:ATP-binding cassette subfamily B protein
MKPQLYPYIKQVLKPYRLNLIGFMAVGLIWACLNTLAPYVLKLLIDAAVNFKGPIQDVFLELKPYIIFYPFTWTLLCINMLFLDFIKIKTFPSLREDILSSQFSYLIQHEFKYFQNHFAGNLANKIVDLQGGIVNILTIIDDCYEQTVALLIALLILLMVHPIFALILIVWVILFLAITFYFLKPIEDLSLVFAEARSSLMGKMVDSASNIMNIRLFARSTYENTIMKQSIGDCVQKDRNMLQKIMYMRMVGDISILVFLTANLWTLGVLYAKGQVTLGDFSFIITLSISILWNLWFLTGQFVNFSEEVGRCQQALRIIEEPIGIQDAPHAQPLQINHAKIEFRNVYFHFNKGKSLFQNKSVIIPAGQKVGLVGFSGGGKSTFVNLILRLFELESGEILIDDQDIKTVTQTSLREQISFIPQDTSLFHRSIMDNIRYGNVHASDEDVMKAAFLAHANEFIQDLPEGYQSLVGERGVKLSGGQRQRIAIARAILKNAPILILDEATSALDSKTEQYIQESLNFLMKTKTTIVIAHRLSTLTQMDRILVFDKGRIVEDGSYAELLNQESLYKQLWETQVSGFIGDKLS